MSKRKAYNPLSKLFRRIRIRSVAIITLIIAGVLALAGGYYVHNIRKEADAASGDIYTITPSGGLIPYSGWSTHRFTVSGNDGTFLGFCGEPSKEVTEGSYTGQYYTGTNSDKIKLMAYIISVDTSATIAARDDMYRNDPDEDTRFAYSHAVISYLYKGDDTGLSGNVLQGVINIIGRLGTDISDNAQVWKEAQNYKIYFADASTQDIFWVQHAPKGGLSVTKTDIETTNTNTQGDVPSFSGTKFTIYKSDGTTKVADITAGSNGVASTGASDLDLGTYIVKETTPVAGYQASSQSVTVSVSTENTITPASTNFTNQVYRGNIKVKKCDQETTLCKPLGAASLEGIEFKLYNRSTNAVIYNGQSFAKNALMDTKTTDANGEITFSNLPYGTYGVIETKTNSSYLLSDASEHSIPIRTNGETKEEKFYDQVIRGDLEFNKVDGNTMQLMPNVAFSIASNTTHEAHIVVTDDNGYINTSSSWNLHSYHTNGYDNLTEFVNQDYGTWFGVNADGVAATVDDALGALPYDTYTITELECAANENCRPLNGPKVINIRRNNTVVKLGTWDNNCDQENYSLGTTASDAQDGDKEVPADSDVTIIDTAAYCLKANTEYTILGVLMNKNTGEPLEVNGELVTASADFTTTDACGSTKVEFKFNTTGLANIDLVVFEEIRDKDGNLIVEHQDLGDAGQTIHVAEIPEEPEEPVAPQTGRVTGQNGNNQNLDILGLAVILSGITVVFYAGVRITRRRSAKRF